jgi:hypothetical protein
MTKAQEQIKTILGDSFDRIKQLSESRQVYASRMTSDDDFNLYYLALSTTWKIPMSDIQTLFKSVDIYDKHFLIEEVAA